MSYPSQPGYPTPQYGQQPPGDGRQNNLWLIGGAVVIILVIIMTVTLLLVQQNADSSNSSGGGDGESAGTDGGGDEGGGDEGGGDGESTGTDGGDDGGDAPAGEFQQESCELLDLGQFEEVTADTVDEGSNSFSSSNSDYYNSISCYFYTSDNFYSLNVNLYDYETAEEAAEYIGYDADTYGGDSDYEFAEYTGYGDVGTMYSYIPDPSYQTTTIHVALGSLETKVAISYDATSIDKADVVTALEDLLAQIDTIFAAVK